MEKSSSSIPPEITEFFGQKGGRSLLVKGGAGTGKTTFALQFMEELIDSEKSLYLTTRVSDEALFQHFPWLKEKEMRARIIDSGRVLLQALAPGDKEEEKPKDGRVEVARDFLKSIRKDESGPPTQVDRRLFSVLLEENRMPELERIYDRVNAILPEKATVVVDSVEGFVNKYGIGIDDLIITLQKDLVENSNTNVIFVLEKAEAPDIEYLVDGVAQLHRWQMENRRVREIRLLKLRATEIRQPAYLMTLHGGPFKPFEPFEYSPTKGTKWEPKKDLNGFYSTGIENLDHLLEGGFRRGSYNIVEIDNSVSSEEYQSILRPLFLNFLSQGRGLTAVLPGGDHPSSIRQDMVQYVEPAVFDGNVRILDHFILRSDNPYIVALGDPKEAQKNYRDAMQALDGKPIIDYTGFDTLEYLMGNKMQISELLTGVAKLKVSQNLGIGVIKPGLKLAQEVVNMADVYLKIMSINRCPVIFGIKPSTVVYALVNDREKGSPHVKLIPIV